MRFVLTGIGSRSPGDPMFRAVADTEHGQAALAPVGEADVHYVAGPGAGECLSDGRPEGHLVGRRIGCAPSDQPVLPCAAGLVGYLDGRAQPGCAVEHGVVVEHGGGPDEMLELSDSRAVDRGLFEHGEPVVVVACGAVGPHVMEPLRQLAAMRSAQLSSSRVSAAYSAFDMTTPVGGISRELGMAMEGVHAGDHRRTARRRR